MPKVNININIQDTFDGKIRVELTNLRDVLFDKAELLEYIILLAPIVKQQDKIEELAPKRQKKINKHIIKSLIGDE